MHRAVLTATPSLVRLLLDHGGEPPPAPGEPHNSHPNGTPLLLLTIHAGPEARMALKPSDVPYDPAAGEEIAELILERSTDKRAEVSPVTAVVIVAAVAVSSSSSSSCRSNSYFVTRGSAHCAGQVLHPDWATFLCLAHNRAPRRFSRG